jgi:cell division protein FtsW
VITGSVRPIRARNWMLVSVCILLVLGTLAVFTASSFQSLLLTDSRSATMFLFPHVKKVLIGVLAGLLAYLIPPGALKAISRILYALSIAMLAALLLLKGTHWAPVIKGAARWIMLGGFTLTPSEIARFAYILLAATLISEGRIRTRSGSGVALLAGLALLPAAFIVIQPDFASAVYLIFMMMVMLFLSEARFKDMFLLVLILLGAAAILAFSSGYRRERIESWLSPTEVSEASTYQPRQACIALGSGGLLGRGIGRGRQQRGFLPEASSDYILAVIGEESGFAGVTIILGLLFVITMSGWVIAERADHLFGYLAAGGLVASIALGMFIHIGVVTGIIPCTGMPLPMVSWGGSNLMVTLGSLGIISRVAREGGGG